MKTSVSSSNTGGKGEAAHTAPSSRTHTVVINLAKLAVPGRGAPASPAAPDCPGKGGHPSSPKSPATPLAGGQTPRGAGTASKAPSPVSPGSPAPVAGAPHRPRLRQRRAGRGAPALTHSHWRRQQQPLTSMFPCILAVWNIAFSFIVAVCVRACAVPRELLNPAAGSLWWRTGVHLRWLFLVWSGGDYEQRRGEGACLLSFPSPPFSIYIFPFDRKARGKKKKGNKNKAPLSEERRGAAGAPSSVTTRIQALPCGSRRGGVGRREPHTRPPPRPCPAAAPGPGGPAEPSPPRRAVAEKGRV